MSSATVVQKPQGKTVIKMWEQLRKDARKYEGELDVKLANYSRLCAGLDSAGLDRGGSQQFAHQTAMEISTLLQRLGEVNQSMEAGLTQGDTRQRTLSRHRDILQDFTQEFGRLNAQMSQAQDRAALLSGAKEVSPLLGVTIQASGGALLRERNTIQASTSAIDAVLNQAGVIGSSLREQRSLFDGIGNKLMSVGAKFPVINGLMNAIRRKKSKDTIIITLVIFVCSCLLLAYWLRR